MVQKTRRHPLPRCADIYLGRRRLCGPPEALSAASEWTPANQSAAFFFRVERQKMPPRQGLFVWKREEAGQMFSSDASYAVWRRVRDSSSSDCGHDVSLLGNKASFHSGVGAVTHSAADPETRVEKNAARAARVLDFSSSGGSSDEPA